VAAFNWRPAYRFRLPREPVAVPGAAAEVCSALGAGRPYGTAAAGRKPAAAQNAATCGKCAVPVNGGAPAAPTSRQDRQRDVRRAARWSIACSATTGSAVWPYGRLFRLLALPPRGSAHDEAPSRWLPPAGASRTAPVPREGPSPYPWRPLVLPRARCRSDRTAPAPAAASGAPGETLQRAANAGARRPGDLRGPRKRAHNEAPSRWPPLPAPRVPRRPREACRCTRGGC
jgi:hypothetical protein